MTAAFFGLFVSGFCACNALDAALRGDVAWAITFVALSAANFIIGARRVLEASK